MIRAVFPSISPLVGFSWASAMRMGWVLSERVLHRKYHAAETPVLTPGCRMCRVHRPHGFTAGVIMKLGLYSITYLGLWYQGPALTIEDVILRARRYGYDGIE